MTDSAALNATPDIRNCAGVVEKECGSIGGVWSEGAANAQIAVANGMIYAAAADTLHVFGLEQVPPTTSVVLPANGSVVSGTAPAWATAADNAGVANVEFHLTGGTLHDALISTGTFGVLESGVWTSSWDTTAVPNGTYTLNSVATDYRRQHGSQRRRHDHGAELNPLRVRHDRRNNVAPAFPDRQTRRTTMSVRHRFSSSLR